MDHCLVLTNCPDAETARGIARALLTERLANRSGHFFAPSLLDSQLDTLELLGPDEDGVVVDMALSVEDQVDLAIRLLGLE